MNAKAAITFVTKMQTAPILLGFIIALAKKDLLGMDTRAQVEYLQTRQGTKFNSFSPKNARDIFELSTIEWLNKRSIIACMLYQRGLSIKQSNFSRNKLLDAKTIKCQSTVSQLLTSVKEITPVTWTPDAKTPLDHMYVNVILDILKMDKTAQVNFISF